MLQRRQVDESFWRFWARQLHCRHDMPASADAIVIDKAEEGESPYVTLYGWTLNDSDLLLDKNEDGSDCLIGSGGWGKVMLQMCGTSTSILLSMKQAPDPEAPGCSA